MAQAPETAISHAPINNCFTASSIAAKDVEHAQSSVTHGPFKSMLYAIIVEIKSLFPKIFAE